MLRRTLRHYCRKKFSLFAVWFTFCVRKSRQQQSLLPAFTLQRPLSTCTVGQEIERGLKESAQAIFGTSDTKHWFPVSNDWTKCPSALKKSRKCRIFFPDTLWLMCSDLILYNMTKPAYSVFEVRCSVLICAYFTFNGLFHNLVQMDKSIFKMFLLWLCSHFVLCYSPKLAFKNLYCNYTAFLINIAIFLSYSCSTCKQYWSLLFANSLLILVANFIS